MIQVSVITVCLNAAETIGRTIASVKAQRGVTLEHIVIDGESKDGTRDILATERDHFAQIRSERDGGLYDAMNKGLALAKGEMVGFLNADDRFASPNVLKRLWDSRHRHGVHGVYGDVMQVDARDRLFRHIRGVHFSKDALKRGLMPPHPAFYVSTDMLRRIGGFDTRYRAAADFDLIARLYAQPDFRAAYEPGAVTMMKIGGQSTRGLKSTVAATADIIRSCRANGIKATQLSLLTRYPLKVREVAEGHMMRFYGWNPET